MHSPMALLSIPNMKPSLLKPYASPFLSQNPNPKPSPLSISLRNSPSLKDLMPASHGLCLSSSHLTVRCSANNYGYIEPERGVYPKPEEIEWNKDLVNSVRLIGTVGQSVQFKNLPSGKAVAWTRLGVWKSATETTWVNLTFWDDLAHIASQHLETGQRIFVLGRLVSDTVKKDDEKPQVYYKVVVQQLNFVDKSSTPGSLYESEPNQANTGGNFGNFGGNSTNSVEELWQAFFANPLDWWDNRKNKRSPNYPDFKHKHTGEALWINGRYNPHWVNSQLEILDSKMGSLQNNGRSSPVSFMYADDLTSV